MSVCVGAAWVQLGHAGECALCGAWARPEVGCRVHRHGLGHVGEGCGCVGEGRRCVGKGRGCIGEGHGFVGEGHGSECIRHVECVGEGHGQSECVRHVGVDHGGCMCMGIGHGLGGVCGQHRTEKTATPPHLCLAVTPLTVSTASHPLLISAFALRHAWPLLNVLPPSQMHPMRPSCAPAPATTSRMRHGPLQCVLTHFDTPRPFLMCCCHPRRIPRTLHVPPISCSSS